ncbi:MAG: DUF4956 domain-containing protein [Zetaproteobacteria bacterium]|nr:DUF4956 domain-containing protein [Zetaproteobacteria bacterium]
MEVLSGLMVPTETWIHGGFDPAETKSFTAMLFLCLLLGALLQILYGLYFRDNEPQDASLGRSMTILTPTLMTIFWIIQYSLPLSVGLLGTLSFVRFRAPVKRAEDISFIVLALACAISCAIFRPLIACTLIALFYTYAWLRNFSPWASWTARRFAVVTYNTRKNPELKDIEAILKKARCKNYEFVSARTYDGVSSFVFNISNLQSAKLQQVTQLLEAEDHDSNINVFFPNGRMSV